MSNCMPVYIALIFLFALITCFSSYDSTIGPNIMPRELDSMAIGYDTNNDTILLFGGYPFSQQFTIFKDNQFTDRGEQYLSSSQTTHGSSQHYTTLDDRLWIINENGKNLLWIDLQTYSATTASFTLPIDVNAEGCLTSHQTYLIVLGGYGGGELNTVQIYDLSNNQWLSDIPTLLKKRTESACLTVNNNTYAIGGWDGSNYLSSIEVLDVSNIAQINTQQWQYLSGALYQPTIYIRAVQYGDYIITIGGATIDGTHLTDINLIDTATGNCDKIGDLAFGTSYAASIIVHNILYIFGGYTASGYDDRYQIIYLPTAAPTKTPTVSPTPKPSFEPTLVPTLPSTKPPTQLPSMSATSVPPTRSLTINPTQYSFVDSTSFTEVQLTTNAISDSTSSFDATYYAIAGSNTIFDSSDHTIGIISTKTDEKRNKSELTIVIILSVILLSVIAMFGYRYWNNNHRYKESRKNMKMDEPGDDIKQMHDNVDGEESIEVRASVVEEGHVEDGLNPNMIGMTSGCGDSDNEFEEGATGSIEAMEYNSKKRNRESVAEKNDMMTNARITIDAMKNDKIVLGIMSTKKETSSSDAQNMDSVHTARDAMIHDKIVRGIISTKKDTPTYDSDLQLN